MSPTRMHTPSCENHDNRDADGLTENGEFYCRPCLNQVRNYARLHVPEALEGATESTWVEECREHMLAEMKQADAEAQSCES